MKRFVFLKQQDNFDCGLACLRMICRFYGKNYSSERLRAKSLVTTRGMTLGDISVAAETVGLHTIMGKITMDKLIEEAPLPLIAHWNDKHYVVVYHTSKDSIWVADPAFGKIKYSRKEFEEHWITTPNTDTGVVLMLEATPQFYIDTKEEAKSKWNISVLLEYLKPYRKLMTQLFIGMVAGGILQLFVPLITQALVDKGIGTNNLNFVYLIMIAQGMLVLSRMVLNLIQGRITVFMNGRVTISLLSDFLIKLMKLPISFFNSRNTGDILQRIRDNENVQEFLTGTTLNMLFSIFNFFFFSIILGWYSFSLLAIYLVGSAIHATWIVVFLKKRRELNYKFFENGTRNQNVLIQLITGMQEIKLHNAEQQKRWEWERVQTRAYHLSLKSLNIGQVQEAGAFFINETKNIIITYITVTSVMSGDITLGMMMSTQYILGSLNAPVGALLSLIQGMQDVKISLERMGEIHNETNEEDTSAKLNPAMFEPDAINLKNVSFGYGGAEGRKVLNDISVEIPQNKITAIVGPSGSGKTTLLKLLLRLHEPTDGEILMGDTRIAAFEHRLWRSKCSAVMQDGFIFSDTVARNISMTDEDGIDYQQLRYAIEVANIQEFVDGLPLGVNTMIGSEGVGLSQGQRQRILIARAVYKNPAYLFLDEATNALDARNEKSIMENLDKFFRSRTVVIVAHRLSTVLHADKILVLQNGTISEEGNHIQLVGQRGLYYSLVQNQMLNQ